MKQSPKVGEYWLVDGHGYSWGQCLVYVTDYVFGIPTIFVIDSVCHGDSYSDGYIINGGWFMLPQFFIRRVDWI